ncbi:MAG: hypothetical protein Q9174_003921 [Haloplaca sp. 1 TL-2023]
MGAGFNRFNAVTVIQTSQGLAEYLLSSTPDAAPAGIVIGHDARHNSDRFAELTAAVFETKGFAVWWYDDVVHTPLVPFAVKALKAAAGVMITASHNPAKDNGYKVYGSNGCQINTPEDALIAASIMQNLEPLIWGLKGQSTRKPILTRMKERYLECLRDQLGSRAADKPGDPFVYTPMHGVGLQYMRAALDMAAMKDTISVVGEQATPDPDFPTVQYPNPEEKGALDLAMALADQKHITLILANDPDADRFAVAEKVDSVWRQFTGDQVGILLAYWSFSGMNRQATLDDHFLTSAVSSQMLSYLGKAEGFSVRETLTGFKWLGNIAQELQGQGKHVKFAYEEAQGYMFPNVVHDKDGIAAAMVFLRACASWGSPWVKLQALYKTYGFFETANTYWRSPSVERTRMAFEQIRKIQQPFPSRISGRKVLRWRDLTTGYDSADESQIPDLPVSSNGQMITCWLDRSESDHGVRFTVRASGTEPKIKVYLECHGAQQYTARQGALQMLSWLKKEWFGSDELRIEESFADV